MERRITKGMELLPHEWTGLRTDYSIAYTAPNLVAARNFLEGGDERLKNHAVALKKDIVIKYKDESDTEQELKWFYHSSSERDSLNLTNRINSKKTMEMSNLNSYEITRPNINSNFVQIASFMEAETNKGNSCRINDMETDNYYYMRNWKPIATPTKKGDKLIIDTSDVIEDANWLNVDPKRHWALSFEQGNHNYYDELKTRLLKEQYLPGFEYHILQLSGKLSQCCTDYYLIFYMGRLCRLAVQNPKNREIINHDTKYM